MTLPKWYHGLGYSLHCPHNHQQSFSISTPYAIVQCLGLDRAKLGDSFILLAYTLGFFWPYILSLSSRMVDFGGWIRFFVIRLCMDLFFLVRFFVFSSFSKLLHLNAKFWLFCLKMTLGEGRRLSEEGIPTGNLGQQVIWGCSQHFLSVFCFSIFQSNFATLQP